MANNRYLRFNDGDRDVVVFADHIQTITSGVRLANRHQGTPEVPGVWLHLLKHSQFAPRTTVDDILNLLGYTQKDT